MRWSEIDSELWDREIIILHDKVKDLQFNKLGEAGLMGCRMRHYASCDREALTQGTRGWERQCSVRVPERKMADGFTALIENPSLFHYQNSIKH